jgi:hypothetical protein
MRLFRPTAESAALRPSGQSTLQAISNAFTVEEVDKLAGLNESLHALAAVFPNVRLEVFREMLSTFSEESRTQIVAEQLIRHDAKWVRGRWRVATRESSSAILKEVFEVEQPLEDGMEKELVPKEETFRSKTYKKAVKTTLLAEFRNLSNSTIDGVLAEQNHSYMLSRPILLGLAAKSWRISFSTLLSRWRKTNQTAEDSHYMVIWTKSTNNATSSPSLRYTGSDELDQEVYDAVLKPIIDRDRETQRLISEELATLLNEQEAEAASAVYECECCFSDTTFEAMATCSEGTHTICFRCIQHAVSEALYGQSWGLNIEHTRSQVACLAPSDLLCSGCIPHFLTQRAVLQTKGGSKTWAKLQSRLADDALHNSGAKCVRCPFCSYAELDDFYLPPGTIRFRLNTAHIFTTFSLLALSLVLLLPFLPQYYFLSTYSPLPLVPLKDLVSQALHTLVRNIHLSQRFTCRDPNCARSSCRRCKAVWRDIHVCNESAALSLRTTIEAARTAALKRTCPRCGLAFVKESGCNKMVCVCGYSMCYICRQGLGRKSSRAGAGQQGAAAQGLGLMRLAGGVFGVEDEGAEGEGYRHFCQHFRPTGGRCNECEKCDLYRGEDEDEIVHRAGKRAEAEWRKRQSEKGKGISLIDDDQGAPGLQGIVNWWVAKVLKC